MIRLTVDIDRALAALRRPRSDPRMMRNLGNEIIRRIKDRTVHKGLGVEGRPLADYSTRSPYYAPTAKAKGGARLAPKGGKLSKSGKSMRFDNYREFKEKSTRTPGARVNYTLSGQTMNRLRLLQYDATRARVGFGHPEALGIAVGLQKRDPFMGVNPEDEAALRRLAEREIARILGLGR